MNEEQFNKAKEFAVKSITSNLNPDEKGTDRDVQFHTLLAKVANEAARLGFDAGFGYAAVLTQRTP